MSPTPVVMDVDTGIDDALSLLFAVRSPDIDLRAVTCVTGNAPVDQVVRNTLYVLDAAGAPEIPVARGATHPLLVDPEHAGHVHGADGLGGFSRPSDRRASSSTAVQLLHQVLMTAIGIGERITLVPSAPLTNIALLLRTHPEVAPGIERILFMGGSAGRGNATAAAEFNIWHDPEAAAVALRAAGELDIPVTMYGLDVFEDVVVTVDEADRLAALPDPAAQLAGRLLRFSARTFGRDGATIGDAGTVCAVADPDGLTTQLLPVQVVLDSGPARGQTLVDRRTWAGDHSTDPNPLRATGVDVALAVDGPRYAQLWLSTLGG
ncbi:nucleoside hydrolase [Nakamurella sp. YIM 132087]|uniref:Nucleoside hydrolase n=1 Tax=Nakamurella alba TaxID=2665158 RepID=A0A7K1FJG2_9ACTN|nr:nucleoside hydrolase [Nakamurella alba]MTD13014.1 nucleoside hydrolase [Nakamurella alba]